MSQYLVWLKDTLFVPLFNFVTPWGIAFGSVIVAVFGLPLLVRAYKKFF